MNIDSIIVAHNERSRLIPTPKKPIDIIRIRPYYIENDINRFLQTYILNQIKIPPRTIIKAHITYSTPSASFYSWFDHEIFFRMLKDSGSFPQVDLKAIANFEASFFQKKRPSAEDTLPTWDNLLAFLISKKKKKLSFRYLACKIWLQRLALPFSTFHPSLVSKTINIFEASKPKPSCFFRLQMSFQHFIAKNHFEPSLAPH